MKTPTIEGARLHRHPSWAHCAQFLIERLPALGKLVIPAVGVALAALASVTTPAPAAPAGHGNPPAAPVRFAVLSDTHFYDTKLGTGGTAFDNYLAADPKLLHLSAPILEAALADIKRSNVRFVIITGDLTKDGEVLNHVRMAQYLHELDKAGIAVFVVPGNHDINNADAVEFRGDQTKPVPSANPAVFRALYQRFGYGQALAHAPDSLSYVAEPVPGLWLLALDSVKWAESAAADHPVVGGRLSTATLAWAGEKLQQAAARGKKVIAFMHHGVNPHFIAQPQVFPDYLVDNWWVVGPTLAGAGLKVIFTGHYHSQDASAWTLNASGAPLPMPLCDIQTGSLLSYPCAYRVAELDAGGMLQVESRRVTQIAANLGGVAFPAYAENFARTLLPYQVIAELKLMFGLSTEAAQAVAPWVVNALVANYAGDEAPDPATQGLLTWLLSQGEPMRTLGQLLYTLWVDLPYPPIGDNTLTVPVGS